MLGKWANMIQKSASEILTRTLDTVRTRANTNGKCFGERSSMQCERLASRFEWIVLKFW